MKVKHNQKRIKNLDKKKFLLNRVKTLEKENDKLNYLKKNKKKVVLSQLMYYALIKLLPNPSTFLNSVVKYPYQLGGFKISLLEGEQVVNIFINKIFFQNNQKCVTFYFDKFNIDFTIILDINTTKYYFCGIDTEVTKYEWDFSPIDLKVISDFDFYQMFSFMKTQKEVGKLFWE